jgi:glyoxylase-like metal-dependent hydrolase (beta-lactamase superfamily II)/rhodanese-related sulfurtransferase
MRVYKETMIIQSFFTKGIAHSSYLLGDSNTCAIIDPRRDVIIYIDAAKSFGMKITHILETHLHADFVSGHIDLSKKTGAKIYAPKSGNCKFDHIGLSDGNDLDIGSLTLSVLETPGHTPEHIIYVITDRARGTEPSCIFCGDTLFVGDVGRPDLFPDRARELASDLYESLQSKLLILPDFCEIYPAHGAGSLCGRAMAAKRSSTIGYEKLYNAALQIKDKDKFIESLTTKMPPAPDHFTRCSEINRKGPAPIGNLPGLGPLDPLTFKKKAEERNTVVLDSRSYEAFGGQHVPGAYHIDMGGNFATFAGWVLPPNKDILLVSDSVEQAQEAVIWLRRVGLDNPIGFLEGKMHAWVNEGLPTGHVGQLSVQELHTQITEIVDVTLVDVRTRIEFEISNIKGATNIPTPELRTRYTELDKRKKVILICRTGHRSSLAASLLKQQGFKDVSSVAGGMKGYSAAGYAPECPMCSIPHGPRFLGQN